MQTKESAFTPQRQLISGNMIVMIIICAGIAWLVLRACSATTSIESPSISKPEATAEVRRVYTSDGKTEVEMCTEVGGDCASIEQGPKADYGTGFHVSADGRTRPNPPKGWHWASCPEGQHVFTTDQGIVCK
jgi:hypothetical protein